MDPCTHIEEDGEETGGWEKDGWNNGYIKEVDGWVSG